MNFTALFNAMLTQQLEREMARMQTMMIANCMRSYFPNATDTMVDLAVNTNGLAQQRALTLMAMNEVLRPL